MPDILAWVYNSRTGTIVNAPKPVASAMVQSGLGWHGTWDSKADALKFYEDGKGVNPGWVKPTNFLSSLGNTPDLAAGSAEGIGNAVEGKFGLTDENIRSWFIRIGEVLLGIVLIGVGIAKLTGTTNAIANVVKARI